ncbi:MAG: hypothetical protein QOK25_741, partial [Thermoleophilaceae bacterium]|nr:hypothetical protein [Thermoleophilaceae bacterium]
LFSAGYLWGYLPRAIGVGLVPLFLLGAERIVDPGRRKPGRSAGWYTAWTAVAGLMAAWIHPWQGETLLLILLALAAWGRFERRYRGFALPALATAAPLVYYFALSRADNAWRHAAHETALPHYAGWLLIAGLAPLAAFAVPGALRAARDFQDRVLVLWPLAGLAVYLAVPSLSSHGLNGLSLPLAVLAVRGFTRLRLPQVATLAAVAALMLPGIVYVIRSARPSGSGTPRFLSRDETRALGSLASTGPPGPVLAPYELGTSVPAFTGRSTWIGHAAWTPDWALRFARTNALFYGRMPPAQARKLVRESGASVVLSDCRSRDLAAIIGASVSRPRHFGCVAVYRVRRESTSVHG